MRIGVISDTHGLLRPEALAAMSGVDHILHAGDVGQDGILDALAELAPLTAIRGNVDHGGRCADLPATEMVELGDGNGEPAFQLLQRQASRLIAVVPGV